MKFSLNLSVNLCHFKHSFAKQKIQAKFVILSFLQKSEISLFKGICSLQNAMNKDFSLRKFSLKMTNSHANLRTPK